MKIGIIVYSHSGNTLSVAQKIEQALRGSGHTVGIEMVEPVNGDPNSSAPVKLKTAPDISPYDAIIFASPVQAFTLARVMKLYLSELPSLTGKKTYCFVTQHLKKTWMGGKRAIRLISEACKVKGVDIISSGIINWSSSARDQQIDELVKRLGTIK
ncbi:MAG: flavodoxin [Anaerolineaceae bacterium]|nr:MAG: flavodoxin [Anaerolineaceae bacterium]